MNRTETIQGGYCGLSCEACTIYIASTEDPKRLTELADQHGVSEEELRCDGCRSGKGRCSRRNCKFAVCAYARDVDFCVECDSYPCDGLREFQSEKLYRKERRM